MDKKCPYCQNSINESEEICPVCHNELLVQCPYCKQTIKAYDEVCPKCGSQLKKKDYSKTLVITGIVINVLWILVNLITLFLLVSFPQIFTLKDGDAEEIILRIGQIMLNSAIVVAIPYIIAIVKNYKRTIAICGLVANAILLIIFILSIVSLYLRHA